MLKYVEERGNSNNDDEKYDDPFRKSDGDQDQKFGQNVSLTFFLYDKKLNVKMTSIHALVRKYAEMIFK